MSKRRVGRAGCSDLKKMNFFQLYFFLILIIKILHSYSLEMLDPDPDSMNPDPQPFKKSSEVKALCVIVQKHYIQLYVYCIVADPHSLIPDPGLDLAF